MSLPVFVAADEVLRLLGWSLLHFLWEGTLVALLLSAVLAIARQSSAQVRYAICCAALALMALCPIATFAYLEQASGGATHVGLIAENASKLGVAQEQSAPTSMLERATANANEAMPWVFAVWMIGVLVFLARVVGASMAVRRLRTASIVAAPESVLALAMVVAERLGISEVFEVYGSGMVTAPTVVGWLKPMILFPVASMMSLAPEQLEAMLAHELAHIRRRDYLLNALQVAVETLLFYHPGVWWVSRQIRREREHCCDDVAVAVTGSPLVYAKALYLLEEQRAMAPQLMLGGNGGQLTMRIKRLLTGRESAAGSGGGMTWLMMAAFIAMAAGVVAFTTMPVKARAQNPAPAVTAGTDTDAQEIPWSEAVKHLQQIPTVPKYPEMAKAARVSGDVKIAMVIGPKGTVEAAHVVSGEPMLQQAALDSVIQYKFLPITDHPVTTTATITFTLGDHDEKPDLSCTYYDNAEAGHAGTCELNETNGSQYLCRRNDGDKQAQLQVGCKEKVEAVKTEQSHLDSRVQFRSAWEARRTNQ
jgi:bla regulator protein blaR1